MQSKQPPMPCAVPKGIECKGELIVGPTLRTTSNLALGVVDVILSLSPELTGGLVRLSAVGKNEMTDRRHEQAGTFSHEISTYG